MVAGLLVLALAVRVAVLALTPDYVPVFDSSDYDRHALSIAAGDGYPVSGLAGGGGPTAFRPPVYPYVLAAVYELTGQRWDAGRAAGALFGALAAVGLYLIALRLWGRRVAVVAGALAAALPAFAIWNAALLSEPLFLLILTAAVLAVLIYRDTGRLRWAVAAGALCGLAALTRSNGILLALPAAIGVWTARPRFSKRALAAPAAVALATALVVAPWTVRNAAEFDRLVPTTTQSGYALAGVYNDAARGDDEFPATWLAPQFDGEHRPLFEDPRLDEAELDRELRSRAREYALDHPAYVLKATALNTLRMFELVDARGETSYESGGTDDAAPAWLLDLARWSAWAMIALALAGAGLLVRARGRLPAGPAFLWLVPILMLAAAVPISGGARYRAPLDPFLALLAAIALAAAWDRVVERRRAHPAQ